MRYSLVGLDDPLEDRALDSDGKEQDRNDSGSDGVEADVERLGSNGLSSDGHGRQDAVPRLPGVASVTLIICDGTPVRRW